VRVNVTELVSQMEAVQQSLELTDKTSPLADLIGDWVRAVEWLGEEIEACDPDSDEVVNAVAAAVSSAKGMQPIDHRSD
jgi:hypothetical protein